MKIEESKIKEYSGTTFNVNKVNGVSRITFNNGDWIENKEYYGEVFLGDCVNCKKINELYKDFTFDKILILGLGLGLLPNYAKHVKNCSVVDVVDNNSELISYVDYLDDSINVIEADVLNYTPIKEYDLIIVDLWWNDADVTEELQTKIDDIYNTYLTSGGKIIFPLIAKQLTKK
jgi:spermidine synthase|tara:strand:- start:673 stop:1197 length:525 start_codon:yes stop_codon:yes gene_type:complete